MAAAEELGPGQQRHQRLGEEEDHQHVDQRGQAQGEGEPLTDPMASMNRTSADSMETVSAIKIVCRARRQPVSTAVRRLRPSRTSSRIRSKKITKLSAVIPMATMAPAMPGRLRANPTELPSSTIQA